MTNELCILLVDDEDFYLRLFADMLSARRFQIRTARSGEEALALLRRERIDVVITDLLMEGMDGLALTGKVRNSFPWVDIIMITQRDDVRLAVRSMKMGVFEYLVKPIDRDELLLTIDRLMERRRLLDRQNKLLNESMEYLQGQTVYRRCLDILATLDFESLGELILRHLLQATGAQGGLLWLASAEERNKDGGGARLQLASHRGLVAQEDFPVALVVPEGPWRAAYCSGQPFFATPAEVCGTSYQSHSQYEALFIPLKTDEAPVGLLLLLDKLREDFTERDQNIARTMSEFAAIALRNSRRFEAIERLGLRDQSSPAYNLTYFIDYAGREIYKARRYGRAFSLVIVAIDRPDFLRDNFEPEVSTRMSHTVAEILSRLVRDSDVFSRVSEYEYYVMLSETDALSARFFIRRCIEAIREEPFMMRMKREHQIGVTLGSASFPLNGYDFDQLLCVCREELIRNRSSIITRLNVGEHGFWETVRMLIGGPENYQRVPDAPAESAGESAYLVANDALLDGIEEEVAQQAVDVLDRRAILYVAGPQIGAEPTRAERALAGAQKARAFVLGCKSAAGTGTNHPAITRIFLDDSEFEKYRLMIVLSERLAYTFMGQRQPDSSWLCFHSRDQLLVESLIAKLQEHYNFQRQY